MQTVQPVQINNQKSTRPKLSVQDRQAHVKAWRESGMSAAQYSKQNNLNAATLYSWNKTCSLQKIKTGSFIPMAVSLNSEKLTLKQSIEIKLGSGVQLVVPHLVDINAITKLIQELLRCS